MKKNRLIGFVFTLIFSCCALIMSVYANVADGYEKIGESQKLNLYFNEMDSTFQIENKITGYTWSTFVGEDKADISKLNAKWQNNLKAPFILNYTSKSDSGGVTLSLTPGDKDAVMVKEPINNGVRLTYTFSIVEPLPINAPAGTPPNPPSLITVAMEAYLEDDSFVANIPFDRIVEEGKQGVASIEIFPSLGAAMDGEDGYIFYPQGSGAIMDFSDLTHYMENSKTWSVYGSDVGVYIGIKKDLEFEQVMMPVYGAKIKNNGILAVIERGAETSRINLTPSGSIISLNQISGEFIYRRFFDDPRVKSKVIKKYDTRIIEQDYTVRYIILEDEESDYSGMANAYRNYLIENGLINQRINPEDEIPLGLDFFMGINERVMFFQKFIPMTKFTEAKTILETAREKGVYSIQSQLKGWTKKGYGTEPLHFPANSRLGGDSKLKDLMEYSKANGVKLYLQADLSSAYNGISGFSTRNDVAYYGNERIVESHGLYMLSPSYIKNYFANTFIKKGSKFNELGISYSVIGDLLYYDYNTKNYTTKKETVDIWEYILSKTSESFTGTAVSGGNQYALAHVERLTDIPETSKGYFFATESVPFYQMVVHGMIPYSGNAGNLSHDYNTQKLKWIEWGYMPYFEITYESSEKLNYTSYNKLFTSKYTDWLDIAVDTYKEFNSNLRDIWSAHMVKHEKISDNVYRVTYSNGTIIYVNYTEQNVSIDGNIVEALDYLVLSQSGRQGEGQ